MFKDSQLENSLWGPRGICVAARECVVASRRLGGGGGDLGGSLDVRKVDIARAVLT